jgi:hypothetical protein
MPDNDSGTPEERKLRQIREEFAYYRSYWRENYEESAKDMDCMAGIPPKEFSEDRAGRPCIWPDETSQYIKQANNNLRQNKRSINVSPRSEDATDKDAEHRQAYMRGIEYASKAQSVYSTVFECCTEGGFGFGRVVLVVTGPKGEQEPRIRRIPNWSTAYPDPDALEADFSDSNGYFVLDSMRDKVFKRKFPKAKKHSFSVEDRQAAPDWLSGDAVVVAEYWEREEKTSADGEKTYEVRQYLVNGIEFLHSKELGDNDTDKDGIPCRKWIGSWIPICAMIGEEIYVKEGGQSKRRIMSMIRRGRVAQQMMAYVASQEQEEFSQAPRAPYQGYKGTFDSEQHKNLHKDPRAYVEFNIPTDWPEAWGPPPMPTRNQYTPNIQAYEMAYERWRRSHQAAISGNPLPTDAQKINDKSGVALEKIQDAGATGSFHFMDNFARFLHNIGLQINELITKLAELDSLPKQVLGRNKKDEDVRIKVAPKNFVPPKSVSPESSEHLPEADLFFAHRGQFEVTVGDGPNKQSEREEQAEFADQIWELSAKLGLPAPITMKLLALATRMRNLGALGDEIAELLSPPDQNNLPPQAQAAIANLQGQLQQAMQELNQLRMEKLGKVVEMQAKSQLADKEFVARMSEADKDRETKLAVAEVTTKAQQLSERVAMIDDLMKQWHGQAHEFASMMQEHKNAQELAAQNAAAQQQAQTSDQAHQSAMAAQQAATEPEAE